MPDISTSRSRRRRTPSPEAADTAVVPVAGDGPDTQLLPDAVGAEAAPAHFERPVLLRVEELRAGYGALPVLHGISFSVREGETLVFLGLNGAGKSTTVLNICGAQRPWSGRIEFNGKDATRWPAQQAVKEGIVLVPEGRRVFPELSVEKNLLVGAWSQRASGGWFEQRRDYVFDLLPRLRERRNQAAGTLSGGEQQMLAIGRGLMANPKLLMIDEASLGLAPVIVKEVFKLVAGLNREGITVILVEQNIGALDVADVALVLEKGVVVADVRGEELKDSSRLRQLLLG